MNCSINLTVVASTQALLPGTKINLDSNQIRGFMSEYEDGSGIVEVRMIDGTVHYVKEPLKQIN